MKAVFCVTCRSLESVLVCSYSLSGRFGFNFVPLLFQPLTGAVAVECHHHLQDNSPLISCLEYTGVYCKAWAAGAIRAGQGVMAGRVSSGIRQQLLKIQHCTLQLSVSNIIQRQKYFEQCGVVWAVPLEGLSPLGCHCSASSARFNTRSVLGAHGTWYFVVLSDGRDKRFTIIHLLSERQ